MKKRILLSVAVVLTVVVFSALRNDPMANAAAPQRYAYDTGVITFGEDQILRITVALGDTGTHATALVGFRTAQYSTGACSGGVCGHAISSQTNSSPTTLAAGEGVSLNLLGTTYGGDGVRATVLSDAKNLRVTMLVIDAATSELQNAMQMENYSWGASN